VKEAVKDWRRLFRTGGGRKGLEEAPSVPSDEPAPRETLGAAESESAIVKSGDTLIHS
jgi:transposase-like protein